MCYGAGSSGKGVCVVRTRFVEATQGIESGLNWGKFLVGLFESEEWTRPSEIMAREIRPATEHDPGRPYVGNPPVSLLRARGWSPDHVLVLDLETGEGAMFRPGGVASADLDKHRVWVCPMFEPFLAWLYEHIATPLGLDALTEPMGMEHPRSPGWFNALPLLVELPDAPPAMQGYRRDPTNADLTA